MTNEIRLLAISPSCVRRVNRALFRELAERGLKVHLIVPTRYYSTGCWHNFMETDANNTYEISYLEPLGRHPRLQRMRDLKSVVKAFKPTNIYVEADPGSALVLQAVLAAPRTHVCAITVENRYPRSMSIIIKSLVKWDLRKVANAISKVTLRTVARFFLHKVFAICDEGMKIAEDLGYSVIKVPLGYDPKLFFIQPEKRRNATRASLGLTQTVIAYFGRQSYEKGIHILIDALGGLTDSPWQLLIDKFSEDSVYAQELSTQIERLKLQNRTIFFESSHESMPDFMNAADLVIVPSVSTPKFKEQYGRVIQEAMACGRVVVASDSGANAETMDGHGHLVPEGDPAALATKLRELLAQGKFVDHTAAKSALRNRSVGRQAEIIYNYLQESIASQV